MLRSATAALFVVCSVPQAHAGESEIRQCGSLATGLGLGGPVGTEEYSTPYSDGTASARGGYSRCGGAAEPGVALHYFRTGVLTTLSGRTAHFATNTFGLEGTLRLRAALGLLDLGGQVGLGLLLIREDAFTESEFGEGGRTFVTPAFSVGPVGRLWITEDIGIDLLGDFRLGRSFDSGSGEAFWGSLGLLTGATARF